MKPLRRIRRILPSGAATVGGALAAGALIASRSLARFEIADKSMEPNLRPGDYIIARTTRSPQRGDIVIYRDPSRPDRELVKRVLGVGGEEIAISDGVVIVNGTQVADPWATSPTSPAGVWLNPSQTIFTLGDNRDFSTGDSRQSGPVRIDGLYKAVFRYWPLRSIGRL